MPALTPAERIALNHEYDLDPELYYRVYTVWQGYEFEANGLDITDVHNLLPVLKANALRIENGKAPKRQPPPVLDRIEDEDGDWISSMFDIRNQECLDCELNTCMELDEYYMVQDEIWAQVIPEGDGMICIGCLETRLGRELVSADFTDAPVNRDPEWVKHQSPRLRDRLARI